MEATTFRSTTNTSTTDAFRNECVSMRGGSVCSKADSASALGTIEFHGFSPAAFWPRTVSRRARRASQAYRGFVVPHHDDPVALPVAAAGREAGVFENFVQHRIGQRLAGEFAGRECGPHYVVQFHCR